MTYNVFGGTLNLTQPTNSDYRVRKFRTLDSDYGPEKNLDSDSGPKIILRLRLHYPSQFSLISHYCCNYMCGIKVA